MQAITYISNQDADYTTKLSGAVTLHALRTLLEEFSELVQDAVAAAPMNDDEFADFRTGLMKERAFRWRSLG